MRDGVMQMTAPKPAAEGQATPAATDGAADAADEDAGRYEDDFGGGGDMDNDELVALQAEQWVRCATKPYTLYHSTQHTRAINMRAAPQCREYLGIGCMWDGVEACLSCCRRRLRQTTCSTTWRARERQHQQGQQPEQQTRCMDSRRSRELC